jgi:ATP-dependent protease ClpP protease subunit
VKRYVALILALAFVFAFAPYHSGLRTSPTAQTIRIADLKSADPTERMLRRLLSGEDDEPLTPNLKRPLLAKGEHWVPLLRFTNTEVDDESVAKTGKLIQEANAAGVDAIVLELATPGGSVMAGMELARQIEMSHAPVYCVADGEVASMGFYILQSCMTRMMTKRSVLMMHEPAVTAQIHGKQTDYRNIQSALHAMAEAMLDFEARRLKISKDAARKKIENGQDWNMLYDEARAVGAVDGVVPSVEAVQAAYQHRLRHPPYL